MTRNRGRHVSIHVGMREEEEEDDIDLKTDRAITRIRRELEEREREEINEANWVHVRISTRV